MDLFNLKQKLLNTGLFIENTKFIEYLNLVSKQKEIVGYSEIHHILPRVFYTHNKLKLDNSSDNVIKLSYADHCYAH